VVQMLRPCLAYSQLKPGGCTHGCTKASASR
jgi:hypothetical protein